MTDLRQFQPGQSPFDVIMHRDADGSEWWSAREMMPLLGYSRWENMQNVLDKAQSACRNSGQEPQDHFRDATKLVGFGKGGKVRSDFRLTRFGCYLFAMNGDPDKPEIAAAQRYFAMMTRAAEQSIVVPAKVPQAARPWGVRFVEQFEEHVRYMYMHHIDGFTVASTLIGQLLSLEDELVRHMFDPQPSDRPDISIGLCWSNERRRRGLPEVETFAPLRLKGMDRDIMLRVYHNDERCGFEKWFGTVYLPEKLPTYYWNKPEFKRHGELPVASVADNSSRRLAGNPANLKPRLRRHLDAVGGFFPVGSKMPMLPGTQRTLFSDDN